AVESAALERDHLPLALLPMRIAAAALEEMAAHLLQPARLDGRHRAGEETRGLDQLGGDDPLAGFLGPRPGMHPELDAARPGIGALFVAHADVAEQPGQQRTVDGEIATGLLRPHRGLFPFERLLELLVNVAPFAHAR